MRIDVISIFPEYLAPLGLSLVGKAIDSGLVTLSTHDLREWTHDRHRTVDDTPYGGGAGMVMRPEPWGEALDALAAPDSTLLVLTPAGRLFNQSLAYELAEREHLILACGRYEGIDARVVQHARTRMRAEEISIGDYVLNGGEAAALVVIEALVRLLPGVVGNADSLREESHSAGNAGLLEAPGYTKPPVWRGLQVPDVLLSGHHARVAAWRTEQARARTRAVRPDLWPAEDPGVPGLQVAAATETDAGEMWTLQRAAYLVEGQPGGALRPPPLVETVDDVRASIATAACLVARRSGRLVGAVSATEGPPGVWSIGRLMTAPDLRRRGIASTLADAIERRSPPGIATVRITASAASAAAIAFCRRRGFVESDRITTDDGTELVAMERALTPG